MILNISVKKEIEIMFPAACEKCVENVYIYLNNIQNIYKIRNTNISTLFPPVGNH